MCRCHPEHQGGGLLGGSDGKLCPVPSPQPRPQHVPKAAFAVCTAPAGLEGSLRETCPRQAPGSLAMDTFWRRHLQSSDF